MFLLVPAHPGSPGQRAVKRLLLLCVCYTHFLIAIHARVQNTSDNPPSYPADRDHCSDDVYQRLELGW